MNIEQISQVMNQFEEKFDDLDVATSTVEASIDKVCALKELQMTVHKSCCLWNCVDSWNLSVNLTWQITFR